MIKVKKFQTKDSVSVGQKPMGLEGWRALPEDLKAKYANDIINRIHGGQKHEVISSELHIGRSIITRLAENNGLAQRGQYRRRNPIVLASPLVTDIDAVPDDSVTLAGQKREEDRNKKESDKTVTTAKVDTKDEVSYNTDSYKGLVKEISEAIPIIKKMCKEELSTELVEVLIVTKGITLKFEA